MSKLAVISGGTRGLGRALSEEFVSAGYEVIALYRSDRSAASELPGQITCLQHDVTAPLLPLEAFQMADELLLVHNACPPFQPKPMHLTSTEELQQQLDVAVRGGWLLTQALLRPMVRRKKGTIVNILSEVVEGAPPKGFAAYTAAKYGLLGLTRALASEYSSLGIRIFSVSPGYMETRLTSNWPDGIRVAVAGTGTPPTPASVAARIRALCESGDTPGRGENHSLDS